MGTIRDIRLERQWSSSELSHRISGRWWHVSSLSSPSSCGSSTSVGGKGISQYRWRLSNGNWAEEVPLESAHIQIKWTACPSRNVGNVLTKYLLTTTMLSSDKSHWHRAQRASEASILAWLGWQKPSPCPSTPLLPHQWWGLPHWWLPHSFLDWLGWEIPPQSFSNCQEKQCGWKAPLRFI